MRIVARARDRKNLHRMSRVLRLTFSQFTLLALAWLRLIRTRLALWLLPWQRMGTFADRPTAAGAPRFSVGQLEWAVRAASRMVPRATCLTQALALNHLLRSDGYPGVVQIGVDNHDGRFVAHAWVECNGVSLLSAAGDIRRYSRFLTWPPAQPDLFR
jgi:hypothetical protein